MDPPSTMAPDSLDIPITYATPQVPFRLLELPPALLALLTSENPPTLHFKAPPATPSTLPTGASEPHASLITPSSIYSVRQVQTSNAIYVVEPTGSSSSIDGVRIVSTVGSFLELVEGGGNAAVVVRGLVPVWDGESGGADGKGGYAGGKEGARGDACVVDSEFEKAWKECICFEEGGRAWRGEPELVLRLLAKMEEVRILTDGGDVGWWRELAEEMEGEKGWCEGLGRTLLKRLGEKEDVMRMFARLVLEAKATEPIYREKFAELWKGALPGGYEVHGEEIAGDKDKLLELIKDWYSEPTPGKIQFKEPAATVQVAKGKPKGKWHEKFAARRPPKT